VVLGLELGAETGVRGRERERGGGIAVVYGKEIIVV